MAKKRIRRGVMFQHKKLKLSTRIIAKIVQLRDGEYNDPKTFQEICDILKKEDDIRAHYNTVRNAYWRAKGISPKQDATKGEMASTEYVQKRVTELLNEGKEITKGHRSDKKLARLVVTGEPIGDSNIGRETQDYDIGIENEEAPTLAEIPDVEKRTPETVASRPTVSPFTRKVKPKADRPTPKEFDPSAYQAVKK